MDLPPELVTGHPELDLQHATLLADLEHIGEQEAGDNVAVPIAFFEQKVKAHLHYEQLLMADYAYPEAEAHRRQHQAFAAWFGTLKSAAEGHGAGHASVCALVTAVQDWIVNHEQKYDLALARHIREHLSASSEAPPHQPPA